MANGTHPPPTMYILYLPLQYLYTSTSICVRSSEEEIIIHTQTHLHTHIISIYVEYCVLHIVISSSFNSYLD